MELSTERGLFRLIVLFQTDYNDNLTVNIWAQCLKGVNSTVIPSFLFMTIYLNKVYQDRARHVSRKTE